MRKTDRYQIVEMALAKEGISLDEMIDSDTQIEHIGQDIFAKTGIRVSSATITRWRKDRKGESDG